MNGIYEINEMIWVNLHLKIDGYFEILKKCMLSWNSKQQDSKSINMIPVFIPIFLIFIYLDLDFRVNYAWN